MQVSVKADIKRTMAGLTDLHKKQIPFAMSKAMNATLKDVHMAQRKENERAFDDVKAFTKNAFLEIRSHKRQWPHLVASIAIKDKQWEYLKFQMQGGTRLPERRAIPAPVNDKRKRRTPNTLNTLLQREDTFSGKPKGHPNAKPGIYKRPKRGRQKASKQRLNKADAVKGITGRVGKRQGKVGTVGKQKGLILLWGYRKSATYGVLHQYFRVVPRVVNKQFRAYAERELTAAIRNAKP